MNRTSILILVLATGACRTNHEKANDHWNSQPESTASQSQAGARDPAEKGSTQPASEHTGAASPASATNEPSSRALSADDRKFVTKATIGGLYEVQSSRLATEKNISPKAREFAQRMLEDHGKANRELESLVHKKGGTSSSALDAKHQEMIDALALLDGREFERKYHDQQVKAHDEAIRLFESGATECEDADLRAFINRTLPTLRAHRKHLDELPMD